MIQLLILADDFTGALDTGVQFAACGADVRVVTGADADPAAVPPCEVLVVDTETRHLPAERAGEIVGRVASRAAAMGVPYLYKKTDSALRGNVGAELAALLEASGEKTLPFLPSFPQIGRCTRGGVHYIQEVPVAQSVFGQDPFEPVRHSVVTELLAAQTGLPAKSFPAIAPDAPLPADEGVQVFDAASREELETAGRRLFEAGRLHVMAGCAGFAAVLPALLGLDRGGGKPPELPKLEPEFFVVCGSVNPITLAQLDEAEAHGFARRRLTPEQKLDPAYWDGPEGEKTLSELRAFVTGNPRRILETNDAGGNGPTSAYAAGRGMDIEDVRRGISRTVGLLVSRLFDCEGLGTMLVTGGDTLLQCMDYMGVHRLRPICELDPGVVLSRFHYHARAQYVITKSGGFGDPNLLLRIADRIAKQS